MIKGLFSLCEIIENDQEGMGFTGVIPVFGLVRSEMGAMPSSGCSTAGHTDSERGMQRFYHDTTVKFASMISEAQVPFPQ